MVAPEAGRRLLPSLEAELDEGAEAEAEKQRQKSKEMFISQVGQTLIKVFNCSYTNGRKKTQHRLFRTVDN